MLHGLLLYLITYADVKMLATSVRVHCPQFKPIDLGGERLAHEGVDENLYAFHLLD